MQASPVTWTSQPSHVDIEVTRQPQQATAATIALARLEG
jgi:hypothetical protein